MIKLDAPMIYILFSVLSVLKLLILIRLQICIFEILISPKYFPSAPKKTVFILKYFEDLSCSSALNIA